VILKWLLPRFAVRSALAGCVQAATFANLRDKKSGQDKNL